MFNARLLFARHNLYPQESVSREAARKEAQIASSCDECRTVGAVRAREYRGGDLLRRDGVLFELTLEGGLEWWVSREPASGRWEGRAEAWSRGAPAALQGGELEEGGPRSCSLAAPSLKRLATLHSPPGPDSGQRGRGLPRHSARTPCTPQPRHKASRAAEGPRAPESDGLMLNWPSSAVHFASLSLCFPFHKVGVETVWLTELVWGHMRCLVVPGM